MTRQEAQQRQQEMEAARKLGELPPMHLELAIKSLESLDEGPEEDHIEADRILLAFIKGIGYPGLALAYLKLKERGGFWYA